MAATYSLSVTGATSHNPFRPSRIHIDDNYARVGTVQQAMRLGIPVLCQRATGEQFYAKFEPELSVFNSTLVVRRV